LGRQKLTGPRGETLISPPPGNLGRQRESTSGPAGGGERGTDDDCTADDCVLGCGGLCCGIGAACWDVDGGGDDIFCLMSSSTVCSVAMFWAICSCLAASCSTLRRTVSRFNAKGSNCLHRVSCCHGGLRGQTTRNKYPMRQPQEVKVMPFDFRSGVAEATWRFWNRAGGGLRNPDGQVSQTISSSCCRGSGIQRHGGYSEIS
jgi:hypothetical protein